MKKSITALTLLISLMLVIPVGCSSAPANSVAPSSAPVADSSAPSSEQAASSDNNTQQSEEDVKIGLIAGLTGAQPLEGMRTVQAVEMAIEEINANGGVLGGRNLVLQTEDDQLQADISVTVMKKLGEMKDVVAVMGPARSVNVLAVDQTIRDYTLPILASGTSPSFYGLENPYLFRCRASDTIFAKIAVKFAVEELGKTKIGLMYNNDDFGNGAKKVIEDFLATQGMTLTVAEGHNTGDKDMTGQLLKLKDAGCDVMISWTHGAESIVIARQFKELGLDMQMEYVGSPGIGNAEFYETVTDEIANGVNGVVDFVRSNPDVKDFVDKFKAKYDADAEIGASAYYDATYILADAINRAGSTDRQAIADALRETKDIKGNQGTMYCDERQDMIHQCVIYRYNGREQEAIGTVIE